MLDKKNIFKGFAFEQLWWALVTLVFIFPIFYQKFTFDEQTYFYYVSLLKKGETLYAPFWWDDKGTWLYFIFSLSHFFKENYLNIISLKIFTVLWQIATVLAFRKLSSYFLKEKFLQIISTFLFIMLFTSTAFEGQYSNANNFVLLPIMIGLNLAIKGRFFGAALVLGFSFGVKQNTAFDMVPISLLMFLKIFKEEKTFKIKIIKSVKNIFLQFAIFLIPMIVVAFYTLYLGTFNKFLDIVYLERMHTHVMNFNFDQAVLFFSYIFKSSAIFWGGFLIFTIFALSNIICMSITPKNISNRLFLLLSWALMSVISVSIGGQFYIHYFIEIIPVIILCTIFIVDNVAHKQTKYAISVVIVFASVLMVKKPVYAQYGELIQNKKVYLTKIYEDKLNVANFFKNNKISKFFTYDYEPLIYIMSDVNPVIKYGFNFQYVDYYKISNQKIFETFVNNGMEEKQNEIKSNINNKNIEYISVDYNFQNIDAEIAEFKFIENEIKKMPVVYTSNGIWVYKNDIEIENQNSSELQLSHIDIKNGMFEVTFKGKRKFPEVYIELYCGKLHWIFPENGINYPLNAKRSHDLLVLLAPYRMQTTDNKCVLYLKNAIGEIKIFKFEM